MKVHYYSGSGGAEVDISGLGLKASELGRKAPQVDTNNIPKGIEVPGNASDTEPKILVDTVNKLSKAGIPPGSKAASTVKGHINLHTQRFPCPRCQTTIKSFQESYPNVTMSIGYVDS